MGRLLNTKVLPRPESRPAQPQPGPYRSPAATLPRYASYAVAEPGNHLDGQSPFRKIAFLAGLGMLFLQMAVLPELLTTLLHTNTYLLYIVGPPAMIGALLTGGVGRTLRHPSAWLWLGFFVCMMISLPFSSWVGGSVGRFQSYAEFSLPFLFIMGGLAVTWREVRSAFLVIGAAGVIVIAAASRLASDDSGRVEMSAATGSIGNANDLASHLILVLPFLLFIAMDRRVNSLIRYALILPAGYAVKTILGTASRGALIALAVCFVFVLFRASAKQRVAAIVIGAALAVSAPFMLQGNALDRLGSLFGSQHEEAAESEEARSYLLKQSVIYTIQNPVFGVGMGQFSNYEGKLSVAAGVTGNWHETHNSFTEVSSECGLPAFIFFVLGIGSALVSVNRTYRQAKRQGYTEIANACFCYLLSFLGFVVSITFLANAYRFYLPAMIGLAIALSTTAKKEMSAGSLIQPARMNPLMGAGIPSRARLAQF